MDTSKEGPNLLKLKRPITMKIALAFVGSLLLCHSVFSKEDASRIEELIEMDLGEMLEVKVATGTAKELSEVPAVVSVITAEDIKAMGARTLAEAIEHVPGLHVAASDNRLQKLFSIRGLQTSNTPQVLVLIDGVEISIATLLSTPVSFTYPVNFIDRIEIIRGPGSAIYGADAFSGVINVITKQPSPVDNAWLNTQYSLNGLRTAFSLTHEKTNGDDDRETPYQDMERKRELYNVHLNVSYGDFTLRNWFYKVEQYMGVGASIFANSLDRDITEAWKTQLGWNKSLTNTLDISADLSWHEHENDAFFQLFPPGTYGVLDDGNLAPPGVPSTNIQFPNGVIGSPYEAGDRSLKASVVLVYDGLDNHRIRASIGGEEMKLNEVREFKNFGPGVLDLANRPADLISDELVDVSGTPFVFSPKYDRELWFLSLQDEWRFTEAWELTAGIRHDHYSDFGSTTNPRLAMVWNTNETLTSKLLYGTAFRAPKVGELAFINNPTVIGNPDLDPEKIQTVELVFDYRPRENLSSTLNLFRYAAEDLIELDETFTYQNIGEQDGHGLELNLDWQASPRLDLSANFSWLEAERRTSEDSDSQDKAQVPGSMGFVGARYQITKNWHVGSQLYWIEDRKREANDDRPAVDDYLKTDINLRYESNTFWQARLSVKNVFNEDVREPSPNSPLFAAGLGFPDDYEMEGRAIFGTVLVSLD